MNDTSKKLEMFLEFLRENESELNFYCSEEKYCNDLTQDILHSLELEEKSYHEMAKLAKEIRDIRHRRRIAKDNVAKNTLIVEWTLKNQGVVKELERLLGEVRKVEKSQIGRVYIPRTDNTEKIISFEKLVVGD